MNCKSFLFLSILMSSFLFSCKFQDSDEKMLHRPDVQAKQNCILITGSYDSTDLEYVIVYRQDADDETAEPIRLGMILTTSFNSHNKTYSFFDETAIEGKTYTYFCRLYQGKYGYYKTEVSDKIKVPTGYGLDDTSFSSDDDLKCSITDTLVYNEESRMLSIKSGNPKTSITRPEFPTKNDYTDFCLIVTNGSSTQSFLLSSSDDGDWNNNADNEWNLQTLLPENYLNTEIQILGIIAQKKDLDLEDNKILLRYLWTNLQTITIENNDPTPVTYQDNKITVKLQSGVDGVDYSI